MNDGATRTVIVVRQRCRGMVALILLTSWLVTVQQGRREWPQLSLERGGAGMVVRMRRFRWR